MLRTAILCSFAVATASCAASAGAKPRSPAAEDDLDLEASQRSTRDPRPSAEEMPTGPRRVAVGGSAGLRRRGQRIDIEFVAADLHNALRLIAEAGGLNLVISDDVRGTISIRLRRVSYQQALDAVLAKARLVAIRHGAIVEITAE